jgi:RNA polymerase sigma factor for flagellar operon FliA
MSGPGRGTHSEDLEADGALGLVEASARFDPTRGIPFNIFSKRRIRGAMLDGIRARHWVGRRPYEHHRARSTAEDGAAKHTGTQPLRVDLFAETGGDDGLPETTELGQGGARWNGRRMVQLPLTDDDTLAVLLSEQLNRLSARDRQLISLHYFEGKSLTEAGRQMRIRRSWASRLHARILRTLRTALGERTFRLLKSRRAEPAEVAVDRKQRRPLSPTDEREP